MDGPELQKETVRLISKTDEINKRANLNKQKPTRRRHYTLSSINKGHVLPFIWMAHPVVPLDEEVPVPVPVRVRSLVH